jgi:glucose-6-phosphate dehydrogenase assembly protein OpcA
MEESLMPLDAGAVLKELDRLWAGLAADSAGAGSHGVLRACSLTLVVFDDEETDGTALGQTLAQTMREHPNRAIAVRVSTRNPGILEHHVSAQCWVPTGKAEQICSEQIEILAGEEILPEMAPILNALTAPDLPVVVWCRSPRLLRSAGFQAAVPASGKLIVDSTRFSDPAAFLRALAASSTAGRPAVADLAWTRLTRWRETLAQAVESAACIDRLREVSQVRVYHTGKAIPAPAYYFAGWVLSCLGPGAEPDLKFESVEGEPLSAIEGVAIACPAEEISIRRVEGFAVLIQTGSLVNCALCPSRTEAELLNEELGISGRDPVYDSALRMAATLAGRNRG